MPKTRNKTTKSLFMVSSVIETIENVSETAFRLSFLARRAYTDRDYNRLAVFSKSLINLSPFTEIGEFYEALSLSKQGAGDIGRTQRTFENLTESSFVQLRAASTLVLGMREMRRENFSEAGRLIIKANKLALSNNTCAPLTAINAQNALSVIKGISGDSEGSLKLLSGMERLVKTMGIYYPAILGEHWNNQAYEHYQLGNLNIASHFITKAITIQSIRPYPEWLENNEDIKSSLLIKKRSQIFIPSLKNIENVAHVDFVGRVSKSSRTDQSGKVLRYPAWSATWLEMYLRINNVMHLYKRLSIPLVHQDAEKMLIKLLTGISNISCGKGQEELTIETYFCSRRASVLISEDGLIADSLDALSDFLKEILMSSKTHQE
jgi:hypothetical protein